MNLKHKKGSSLVITLLVLVVLSTIVVAFMQSMAVERMSARSVKNAYQARLAAEAGLEAAVSQLGTASNFHYSVVSSNVFSTNYGNALMIKQPGGTNVVIDVALFSKGTTNVAKLITDSGEPVYSYFNFLTNSAGETNGRWAFWVDPETSKQNVLYPRGVSREYLTNFTEFPLTQSNLTAWPSNAYSANLAVPLNHVTVKTVNQALAADFGTNNPVTDYYFSVESPSASLTPEGYPKLNLIRLRNYVNGLALDQGPTSARVTLVKNLLNEGGGFTASNTNSPWGGGSLSFFTNSYPLQQARQIVANLIDYIDEDVIPTTDGRPGTGPSGTDLSSSSKSASDPAAILTPQAAPTFLGVEARATSSGTAIAINGHPYITYVGSGFQINSGANPINSTRIYGWMQIVNPWEGTNTWRLGSSDGYFVDMQVKVDGTVISGANRGTAPQAAGSAGYFLLNSLGQVSGYDGSHAGRSIAPKGKVMFPREWHASGFDLANGWYTINNPAISISGFKQRVEIARLIYRVGSQRYLIQDLGVLNGMPRDYSPSTATFDGNATIKYGPTYGQQDWHYVGDPRLSYQSTNWVKVTTSGPSVGPVEASSGNAVYSAPTNTVKDALQNLADTHLWYSSAGITNHFASYSQGYRPSIATNYPPMVSYGEFGFLWAGRPWQTLRLFGDTNATNAMATDIRVADYVDLGIVTNRTTNSFNQIVIDGLVNVNSRKRPTLTSVFSRITNVTATNLTEATLGAATKPLLRGSDLLTLTNSSGAFVVTNSGTLDFAKERLYGQLAPVLTAGSANFTVYAFGQTLFRGRVVSTVLLQATVEMTPRSNGLVYPVIKSIKQL